ncbi:MAG: S-methyl-5'-thioadenosine phosphorylase [Bradymonadales bacterium]|nr:S-methyl-5'-thioadenosine phosphorylase [Bradymonadales bacterium]
MENPVLIAVIGGTGLYEIEGLRDIEERVIHTPWGQPSDAIRIGRLGDRQVAFLSRHGRGHRYNPTQVPARANIWALKSLGVFWVISVSAVGSLRSEIEPCHFVIPDQIIDRTYRRPATFYEEIAIHVGFSHPFHPMLADLLYQACQEEQMPAHRGGTYVCIEGPMFSTKAESQLYRSWGASVVGMTAIPEAKLAREAEMCYATVALATDYDVWKEEEYVQVDQVMQNLARNIENVRRVIGRAVGAIPLGTEERCDASRALETAILTDPSQIDPQVRQDLALFLGKYLPGQP